MIKAVIFDLDGTLVDTEAPAIDLKREFAKKYNMKYDEEYIVNSAGRRFTEVIDHLAIGFSEELKNKIHKEMIAVAFDDFDYVKNSFANVVKIIEYLKMEDYKVVLATNSRMWKINDFLVQFHWENMFDLIVSADDVTRAKPDPQIYEITLSKLGVKKDEVVVVEDSKTGIVAAKAIGLKVICRKENRFKMDQSGADQYIDDLWELSKLI